jgi:hypothetical protein
MKKVTWIKRMALASFIIVLIIGCHEEPLQYSGGADCGGCEDVPPGGDKVKQYCGDLIISNLSYKLVDNSYLQYYIEIKNIGQGAVDNLGLDAVVSEDEFYGGGDAGACGTSISPALASGQTLAWDFRCYAPELVNEGRYLIMHVRGSNDCNSANNYLAILINQ